MEANRAASSTLKERLGTATDANVRRDLEILVQSVEDDMEGQALDHRLLLPYFDAPQTLFFGIRSLLDDQVAAGRRPAALTRLRRYAGREPGTSPFLELAADRIRERLGAPGLVGPSRDEVLKHLGNAPLYVDGIAALFPKFGIEGADEPLAALRKQVADWDAFVRKEVLPRAREDFRLPPELYAFGLKQYGVDVAPDTLAERARVSFMEIRNELQALAPLVAKQKGLASSDYHDVIRALKKDQIVGEAILPHYEARLKQLEEIVREHHVVSLPERPARIRLASEAESAQIPAPHMRPPRLIGNTGERGEFVLPLRVPTTGADGTEGEMKGFDDFTFDAASWTLTVHEARPGHEMQFAELVESGVSLARGIFAFNSVNVEGWALYAEAEMKPYLPLDGQLVALQHRLLRAARAFLDPDLQAGRVTPDEARRVLMEEVVMSEPMARQEVERYTFRSPGQATSYFYGYQRWMELKARAMLALGDHFDRQRYHDFILSQGLLPPGILGDIVMTQFVPAEQKRMAAGAAPGTP